MDCGPDFPQDIANMDLTHIMNQLNRMIYIAWFMIFSYKISLFHVVFCVLCWYCESPSKNSWSGSPRNVCSFTEWHDNTMHINTNCCSYTTHRLIIAHLRWIDNNISPFMHCLDLNNRSSKEQSIKYRMHILKPELIAKSLFNVESQDDYPFHHCFFPNFLSYIFYVCFFISLFLWP